jgi:hypothetical protein
MNVYVKLGLMSNPNQFDFDYLFKNIHPETDLILTYESLGLVKG